jgi:hypothetical protein
MRVVLGGNLSSSRVSFGFLSFFTYNLPLMAAHGITRGRVFTHYKSRVCN